MIVHFLSAIQEAGEELSPFAVLAIFIGILSALPVYFFQNQEGKKGGPISKPKALWLVYAIVLWFLVPVFLWQSAWVFSILALSMGLRGAIEIPLCRFGKWRVWMGLFHDVLHGGLLLVGIVAFKNDAGVFLWLFLMLIAIICEIVFVLAFRKATGGPSEDVFFIPSGEKFRRINTWTLLLGLPQWSVFALILFRTLKP